MSALVRVAGVDVRYGAFTAVRGATLEIEEATTLALVGESGSGKSTLALALSRLLPPGAEIAEGSIAVGDVDVVALRGGELRRARGRLVGYIAQDSMAALNPLITAGRQVAEAFEVADGAGRRAAERSAVELLAQVGIQRPDRVARMHPHQLSGGMRQRVMIAMALALRPRVLVADEPTTALDVTVQAEIIGLVRDLQREHGLTICWITHDMGVVAEIADSVAVMYGGRVVERGPARDVFRAPAHPYTRALLSTIADDEHAAAKTPFAVIAGSPPTGSIPDGCPFHPRCPQALPACATDVPAPRAIGPGRERACHLAEAVT